jgi:probable biosynthetic protein (TIGR04098 family)
MPSTSPSASDEPPTPVVAPELTLAGQHFAAPRELAELDYEVCPYTDLNGVGLLYFASYPRISDICERRHLASAARRCGVDWALATRPVARDVFYYGNVDAGEIVRYRLRDFAIDDRGLVRIWSTLTRADGAPIADLFTVKGLAPELRSLDRELS